MGHRVRIANTSTISTTRMMIDALDKPFSPIFKLKLPNGSGPAKKWP